MFLLFKIDSSPYQGSCPCPIQSFPKNVHIGPLIGSKTDKGPCQKNSSHLHDSALNPIQFKQEKNKSDDLDVVVKPEIIDSLTQYDTNHKSCDSIDRSYEKIALVPQHHPNYTLNPKLLEQPEMSISPARGSIGPGVPKIQAGATQPLDVSLEKPISTSLNQSTPVTSRRARVGKSMAREMMLQSHPTINDSAHEMDMDLQGDSLSESKGNICASTPIKEQIHNDEYEKNNTNTPHFMCATKPINGTLIKQENVKKECDDDILLISDKSESETISSDHEKSDCIQIIDLSSDNGIKLHTNDNSEISSSLKRRCDNESSADEIIDLDEDNTITTVKRRKILEFHKNPSKKSPPNSYKNLIRPSDPKSYLCRADSRDKDLMIKCSTPRTEEQSTGVSLNGTSELDSFRNGTCDSDSTDLKTVENSENRMESLGKSVNTISLTMPSIGDEFPSSHEFPQELSAAEEETFMSHLDSNSESISKGYCSDNEVLSRKKERLKTKLQKCEGRSRSESKKSEKIPNGHATTKADKSKPKSRKNSSDRSASSSKSKERTEKQPSAKKAKLNPDNETPTASKKKSDSKMKKSKTLKTKKSCEKTKKTLDCRSKKSDSDVDDALLDNESHIHNNNNNILLDKNNKLHLEALVAPTFNVSKSTPAKKPKSRGSKFSNKKKHRARHPKHIEEVIIPRQTSAAPRWSNGWNWLGEPFQGKVFLNSDDHQVVRTRYPAMRHDCGDTIRPGDCVLLRAGSKKNELPYVAKVASLWENPEDGMFHCEN